MASTSRPARFSIVPDSEDEADAHPDQSMEQMLRGMSIGTEGSGGGKSPLRTRTTHSLVGEHAAPSTPAHRGHGLNLRKRPDYPTSPYVYELSPTPPRHAPASPTQPRSSSAGEISCAQLVGAVIIPLRSPLKSVPVQPRDVPLETTGKAAPPPPSSATYTLRTPKRLPVDRSATDLFFNPAEYPVLKPAPTPLRSSTSPAMSCAQVIDLTHLPATPVHRRRRRTLAIRPFPGGRTSVGGMGLLRGPEGHARANSLVDEENATDGDDADHPDEAQDEVEQDDGHDGALQNAANQLFEVYSYASDSVSLAVCTSNSRLLDVAPLEEATYPSDIDAELAFATALSPSTSHRSDGGSPTVELTKKGRKKRLVLSSDEESEAPRAPVRKLQASRLFITEISDSSSESDTPLRELGVDVPLEIDNDCPPQARSGVRPRALPRTAPRRGRQPVSRFIADTAAASDSEDDGYSDDSMGSLRDFIVDDEESDAYSEEEASPPRRDTGKIKPARMAEKEWLDSDIVLQYSPPPRLKKIASASGTPGLTALREVISIDDSSDEEPSRRPPPQRKNEAAQPPETPGKQSRSAKRGWAARREVIVDALMAELDESVFRGELVKEHGIKARWNVKLLTTAGRAHWKGKRSADGTLVHDAHIELSTKVLDEETKILNTVAHELCHLAAYILSGETKNPHGRVFKDWANKIMRVRRDITIATKHSYEIVKKYEWKCINKACGQIYGRHSKSIDIEKSRCGRCKCALEPLFGKAGGSAPSAFQTFLKLNMKLAKAALPAKTPHGDLMRCISERWKAAGAVATQAEHEAHWREMALEGLGGLKL